MKALKNKLLATILSMIMIGGMLMMLAQPSANAYSVPYTITNTYVSLKGDLKNDTYLLYPYMNTSLNIGFSKYGEMIDPAVPVGLRYGSIDAFADYNVSQLLWNEGWVMGISFTYTTSSGSLNYIWAYALYSDGHNYTNPNWVNGAKSPLDERTGYAGGRKTNGYAVTAPIQVLYDGAREVIALLQTTIYDPAIVNPASPSDSKGIPILTLYTTVDFSKDQKYVLVINDIVLSGESKELGPVQVAFSDRGEWDIGTLPYNFEPESYAHFYHDLPTEYSENPWYMVDDDITGYDLCQMIDEAQNYVAYAAYWPNLMSWRVEDLASLTPSELFGPLSLWSVNWTVASLIGQEDFIGVIPGYYQEPLYYPGNGVFPADGWTSAEPQVYVNGVLEPTAYYSYSVSWGEPGGYERGYPGQTVPATNGYFYLDFYTYLPQYSTVLVRWTLQAEQDDMTYEPGTPYTIGEWVFDLSTVDPKLPTNQFRCVVVYGVNELNDADDWNIGADHSYVVDKEVLYQLSTVFNPMDLRQAFGQDDFDWWDYYSSDISEPPDDTTDPMEYSQYITDYYPGKWTERWVQNYTGDGTTNTFWLSQQIVVPGEGDFSAFWPAWDAYDSPREKVLVNGVLQVPGVDYEIYWNYTPAQEIATGPMIIGAAGKNFTLLYPRIYPDYDYEYTNVYLISSTGKYTHITTDYDIDWADGVIFLWDLSLSAGSTLWVNYTLNWPASEIMFYPASIPPAHAHVEVLYSTFRITYQTDKLLYDTDGLYMENNAYGQYSLGNSEGYSTYLLRYGPVVPYDFLYGTVMEDTYPNWIDVLINGYAIPQYVEATQMWYLNYYGAATPPRDYYGPTDIQSIFGLGQLGPSCITLSWGNIYDYIDYMYGEDAAEQLATPGCNIEVTYPTFSGRYEWTTVGTNAASVDSAGAAMVTEGLRQWNEFDTVASSLDYQQAAFGPYTPYIFENVSGPSSAKTSYYDTEKAQVTGCTVGRLSLKNNWGLNLPISSSNVIVVGGTSINLGAEYFNDFISEYVPRVGASWGTGFTSVGSWNRTMYTDTATTGYATISAYRDLNGTVGLIIQGWSGQDTYYACYALQYGLTKIMQYLQPGVTSIVLKFNYKVNPCNPGFFSVVEAVGTFTEMGGFDDVMFSLWDGTFGSYPSSGTYLFKLAMNSYSSEYWTFEFNADFTTQYWWNLPAITSAMIEMPNPVIPEIYFAWTTGIHAQTFI